MQNTLIVSASSIVPLATPEGWTFGGQCPLVRGSIVQEKRRKINPVQLKVLLVASLARKEGEPTVIAEVAIVFYRGLPNFFLPPLP